MKAPKMNQKNDDLLFQHYLVVFLDVLGQRRSLREIKDLPTTESEKESFIRSLQKTFGKVDKLRNGFKDFFESANTHAPNTALVPDEHREEFLASQKSEAYYYGFSDSIIIAVPLMNADENCTAINGVFSAMVAASGIGFLALADRIALRGGLDVGVAAQIQDKEIYGPALERAYFLESQLAEYPRFVVGGELINYLLWVEKQQCKTRLGLVAKELARFCRQMIIRDTDGRFMLDFMGTKSKEAADNTIDLDVVKLAYDFIISQHKKHIENGNQKLSSRYYRLLSYFNSRAKLWGLQ
jgi:hypothetical protein